MAKDYKDTQVYDDGQKCPSGARQTKVRYMCGVSKGISSIIEPSECHYEMTVVHPSLCGAGSPFEVFSGQINSEIKSTDDHYFMSLEKSVGGNYVCTVNIILREMKEKADVCFSKFALQISSSKKRTITMKQVVARHFGREFFRKSELKLIKSDKYSYAAVNGEDFNGSLEYIRMISSY